MSDIFLSCLILDPEDGLQFENCIWVEISPSKHYFQLQEAIINKAHFPSSVHPEDLLLYAPNKPIPIVRRNEFEEAVPKLRLHTPEGRSAALTELSRCKIAECGLPAPIQDVVQVVVMAIQKRSLKRVFDEEGGTAKRLKFDEGTLRCMLVKS